MAVFEYEALTSTGRKTKGSVDADSERVARQRLRSKGIFPTAMEESRTKQKQRSWNITFDKGSRRVGTVQLAIMTRQLATLLAAGMPLVEALRSLIEQTEHPRLRHVVAEVADQVNEGSSLAKALQNHPRVFPKLYVNMVASAETSGTLDMVLERLADLFEGQATLRRKLTSALTYPILMLLLCVGAVILLLAFVVPEITAIFEEQGATLPLPTQVVIALSSLMQRFGLVLLALLIVALAGLKKYYKTSPGQHRIDRIKLKLPILGPLTLKVASTRFARNLGVMLASGVELLRALGIAKNILGNVILEEAVEAATEGVREGRALSAELKKSRLFPSMLVQMIAIGERSGELEPLLIRVADSYESEVNSFLAGLTSVLEPVLILILACVVGGILLSVMLPMLEMSSLAGV